MTKASRRLLGALAATLLLGAACANDDGGDPAAGGTGVTATETGLTTGSTGPTSSDDGGGGRDYGYGSGDDGSGDEGSGDDEAVDITANNFAFGPSELEMATGSDLSVKNGTSDTPHTFTIIGTDVDLELDPMEVEEATLDLDPGAYEFHCRIHSQMTGTLTIT